MIVELGFAEMRRLVHRGDQLTKIIDEAAELIKNKK
jgi:hypothetical protein